MTSIAKLRQGKTILGEQTDGQEHVPCSEGHHQFSESEIACRTCGSDYISKVEVESESSISDAGFRVVSEPLFGYYCNNCERLTMISLADRCAICGKVEWLEDMDDEVFDS